MQALLNILWSAAVVYSDIDFYELGRVSHILVILALIFS